MNASHDLAHVTHVAHVGHSADAVQSTFPGSYGGPDNGSPARPAVDATTTTTGDDELAAVRSRLVQLAGQRPLDLDDATAVDELAEDLYHRVHSRLRHELLVGRERSGVLGDFR